MIKLNSQEYEKLASGIVNDYFTDEVPLTEGVYKVAEDMGLNPHQIKQLVWHANTRAHLDLFEKQSEDKTIEFPLANIEDIILRTYTPEGEEVKVASHGDPISDFFGDLPNTYMEKAADCVHDDETPKGDPDKPKKAKDDKSRKILLIRKTAEEVSSRAQQSVFEYQEAVEGLRWELRKLANHPDVEAQDINQIEIDARSYFGGGIGPVLKDIGLSSPAYEKTASFSTVTDESDPFITRLKTAKESFDSAVKYTKAANYLRKNLGSAL
jgi:hypothetical protein